MTEMVLLGDEAIALAGVHAGLSAAYAYPGTPSTEILEYLLRHSRAHGRPHAAWCTNEKTAYEEALGTSFAGRRAMTSMKHVGLNVAADPFMNSALVSVNGGLVVVAADDPGMHSSQNEQDSRCYADFARIVCLEPANQQEAYDMTREAFDLSERFRIPVLVRLVTRLAHSRAVVRVCDPLPEKPVSKSPTPASWILLPANARRQWRALLDRQREFLEWSNESRWNHLRLNDDRRDLGRDHDGHRAQLLPGERGGPGLAAVAPARRRLPDPRGPRPAPGRARRAGSRARGGLPVPRAAAARDHPARRRDHGEGVGRSFRRTAS